MTSQQIAAIAARNTEKARRIIRDTGIIDIWESAGAEINLVGSLSTGTSTSISIRLSSGQKMILPL